jgi:hypothetical protein
VIKDKDGKSILFEVYNENEISFNTVKNTFYTISFYSSSSFIDPK